MSEENPTNPPDKSESSLSVEIDEVAQTELAELLVPPDPLAATEEKFFAKGGSYVEAKQKQKLDEQHDVHLTRLGYVPKLLCLIVGWLFVTSLFLGFSGFHAWGFNLSEKVLIALITSTTANVLGLFYVVAK